jgi:hypothetical protein
MIPYLVVAILISSTNSVNTTNCPPIKKIFRGDFKCKPGLHKYECDGKIRCLPSPPTSCKVPKRKKVTTIKPPVAPPTNKVPIINQPSTTTPKSTILTLALVGAGGSNIYCNTHLKLLVGLRLRYVPLHIGLQAHTLFNNNFGVRGLIYPIQTQTFNIHLNVGLMYSNRYYLTVQDVNRTLDVDVGIGADLLLYNNLSIIGDIDWYRPTTTPSGFSASKITKHSLQQSLFTIGLLYTF